MKAQTPSLFPPPRALTDRDRAAITLAKELLNLKAAKKPAAYEAARQKLGRCLGTMNADAIRRFVESVDTRGNGTVA